MSNGPSAQEMVALLAQWGDWLGARTDSMLSLEDRVRTAGTDEDRDDLANAFVARKAVDDRLGAITDLAEHDRSGAAALAAQPVVDDLGGAIGKDLSDAAALVDAIVARVEQRVSAREHQSADEVAVATRADADLDVAERLANDLGSQVNLAAQIRSDLVARRDLTGTATQAAALRRELEQIASERTALFDRWAALDARLTGLGDTERAVRELADRCRAKIVQAPALAVPSVAALGDLPSSDELHAMPWAAARGMMAPALDKIERLDAALAEAQRRYQRPLDERDDLRGLLQSFRDKADAHGLGEHRDIEPLYRRTESLLWAAPCDLASARPLVDQYVAAVNSMIAAAGATGGSAP